MMIARMEPALEIHQPEEQHGFRKGHRIEEHLLTANLVVDKLLAVNTPICLVLCLFAVVLFISLTKQPSCQPVYGQGSTVYGPCGCLFQAQWKNCDTNS